MLGLAENIRIPSRVLFECVVFGIPGYAKVPLGGIPDMVCAWAPIQAAS